MKHIPGPMQRRQLHRQLQRAADQRTDGQSEHRPRSKVRIEPPAQADPDHDGAQIEKARCHGRHTEQVARVEHAHGEGGH